MEIIKTNPEGQEITTATKTRLLRWIDSPMDSLLAVKETTILQAINAESVNIAIICAKDKQIAKAIISKSITTFLKFINVGKGMDVPQVSQTVDLILSDNAFRNLKPEDYKVFFEMMMKGYFKSNYYDRMDGNVICECLHMYCGERADLVESESIKRSAEQKMEEKNTKMHPKVLAELKSAIKDIPEEPVKEKKNIEPSEKDLFIKECFNEFDKIYDKKPVQLKNVMTRIIEYKGKKLDVVEYTEARLSEWVKSKQTNDDNQHS